MKKAAIFLSCIAMVSALCHLYAQTRKPAWKGKVVVEDGVKVVKNPSQSLYGEFEFELEEDLTIGGDPNKEEYYFPKGARLSVDDDGNFYVCDGGNRRIQMYDKEGVFVRTIGRQGQGPGEYMYPFQVMSKSCSGPVETYMSMLSVKSLFTMTLVPTNTDFCSRRSSARS